MERVLIVGGSGFLGSHLVQQASGVCKSTHHLDVADPQHDLAKPDPSAVFHKVSLTDAEAVEAVFALEMHNLDCQMGVLQSQLEAQHRQLRGLWGTHQMAS